MGRTKLDPSDVPVTNSPANPLHNQETLDTVVEFVQPGTEKDADAEWFNSMVTFNREITVPERAAPCRCDFIFSGNDAKISFTFNNGLSFGFLREGTTLKANSLYTIKFGAEAGNGFNIKASEDVTIDKCVVALEGKQAPEEIP